MTAEDVKSIIDNASIESPPEKIDAAEELPMRCKEIEYPLGALGPILGEAANRLAYHVQVPKGIAAQSVLSAAALIAQAHIDVQRGNIGTGPVSIFCLSIAESGDRKSSVDRLALEPIRTHEKDRQQAMAGKEKRYKAELEAWEIRRTALIKPYSKKGAIKLDDDRQIKLSNELFELEQKQPVPPVRANITFSEPTAEGIWLHYLEGDPSAGLFSDEGISFFSGHGMTDEAKGRSIHMLSKLWDGDPLTRTRGAKGESGALAQRRLSCHLMVQPVVAAKVLADPLLQGQGFLPRFLICHEKSIAGTRLLLGRDLTKGVRDDPAIKNYWERMTALLKRPIKTNPETGELELTTSRLTGDVFNTWCALHDGIENKLKADAQFVDVKPFGSKAAEYGARIAAVLAFVESHEHPLVDHVERAAKLISYYLESMANQTLEAEQDADALHARDLLTWIKEHDGKLSASDFNKLPNSLRRATVARKLLKILVDDGHLGVTANNTRSQKPSAWKIFE